MPAPAMKSRPVRVDQVSPSGSSTRASFDVADRPSIEPRKPSKSAGLNTNASPVVVAENLTSRSPAFRSMSSPTPPPAISSRLCPVSPNSSVGVCAAYPSETPKPALGKGCPGANGYRTNAPSGSRSTMPSCWARSVPARSWNVQPLPRSTFSARPDGTIIAAIMPGSESPSGGSSASITPTASMVSPTMVSNSVSVSARRATRAGLPVAPACSAAPSVRGRRSTVVGTPSELVRFRSRIATATKSNSGVPQPHIRFGIEPGSRTMAGIWSQSNRTRVNAGRVGVSSTNS